MLAHLKTAEQISVAWPHLRELLKEKFPEECARHPSYLNNLLTKAMLQPDSFRMILYYTETNLEVPASYLVFDIYYDQLLDCKIMFVPVWVAVRTMTAPEVEKFFEEIVAYGRAMGCAYIKAYSSELSMSEKQAKALGRLGATPKNFHGVLCEL